MVRATFFWQCRGSAVTGLSVEGRETFAQGESGGLLAARGSLPRCGGGRGDFLRQVVVRNGVWVALLVWGPAAYRLEDRERWLGWNDALRGARLKLVVQNRRFLLLQAKGAEPNLASQALAAATRALPAQWQEEFGYAPLCAESFTDPEAYAGTCDKASGWEPVGVSEGNRLHRTDI